MRRRPWLIPCLAALLFLGPSLLLLPWPGLQNDEVYFSGPLYSPESAFFKIAVRGVSIPIMLISYTGALKTWLYAALFQLFEPSQWSVRIPMLLAGVGTIWLSWAWVRGIAGPRPAAVTALLLSTDTLFLITNNFDWGPVALQHLLLMGGLVALQRWLDSSSSFTLAFGFFLWGLGLWDKALLIWPLFGLAVACLCVFQRELRQRLRPATVLIAIAAFLFGAAPLIWFNIARPGETATANTKFTTAQFGDKLTNLRATADGSGLFGFIVRDGPAPNPRAPRTSTERWAVRIAHYSGDHHANWMLPAYALALLCFAALWRTPVRRPLLFLLIAMAVEWAQMALNSGTGWPHHVALLWPFPIVFLAIALSAMADRFPSRGAPLLAALVAFLVAENLLTTNQYLAAFIVNGATPGWTDAIEDLARSLDGKSNLWIGSVDWGYQTQLRLLREENLTMFSVDPANANQLKDLTINSGYIMIQHTVDKQITPGVNDRFRSAVEALGFHERIERLVSDRNGRPTFELFRLERTPIRSADR